MSDDKKKKKAKTKKPSGPKRQERRFVATSSMNPWLVKILGAAGASTFGAGAWAYFYGHSFEGDEKLKPIPAYFVAAGAILTGITIWLGTSSEVPIRVGAPGVAVERGEVRRMPWANVAQISWESGSETLVVAGKDESGSSWTFRIPSRQHREAVGWLLKEALDRIPKVVDIRDDVVDTLPGASPHAGLLIDLEPLQVVGRKDATTGKLISYEPDARVCTRCERVYYKRSVPKRCKCGNSLLDLRGNVLQDSENGDDEDEDEDRDEAPDSEPTSSRGAGKTTTEPASEDAES